jgi:alkylation response protein AidB-like acyl-CoA dehydrogenase
LSRTEKNFKERLFMNASVFNPPYDDPALRIELVRRARDLLPLLRKNAAQADRDRRLPAENVEALRDAGLFHIMVPQRLGGFGAPASTHLAVSAALAEACPATSWVQNIVGGCTWVATLLPESGQNEIFKPNPRNLVAGVFTPATQSYRKDVEGGLIVSGKWHYASGCWHGDWGLIGLTEQDAQGKVIDNLMALVPMSQLSIEDTWHTAGMRGSGSACLVAENVFVPRHMMFSVPKVLAWDYATEYQGREGTATVAFMPMAVVFLAGPQLGMARAALQYAISMAGKRPVTYTVYEKQADSVAFQLQIAEASMKVETAHMHIDRACNDILRYTENKEFPDVAARSRIRADTAYGIRNAVDAINLLMVAHGSAGFAESSPMQRWWRDAAAAGSHAVANYAVAMEIYGKSLLGVDAMVTPLN